MEVARGASGCCSSLDLHSSICDQPDCCRVPLCRQFKMKAHHEKRKKDEIRWKLLVKKVWSAKVMSSLSQPKRKREEEERDERDGMKSFGLSPIDCKELWKESVH